MLAWIDLEMTGLEPERHVIVEIATIVTDDELTIIAEGPDLVIHATANDLAHMGTYVTEMHTKSGLLPLIASSSISVADAEAATLGFLKTHINETGVVPLCGNSIGTDRRFLQQYMPHLEAFFHYRNVDVSTLKELAKRWYPDVVASTADKVSSHRALDDIRESIRELEHYRAHLFRHDASRE